MNLTDILKDSNYRLTRFTNEQITEFKKAIFIKEVRGKETPFIKCLVRKKESKLTPEEAVRQLYVMVLLQDFNYPTNRMELEYAVSFGREKKRADIVILALYDF